MNAAICTIQRNRGRWLKEWVAFHYVTGFRKFYIFLHNCSDDSRGVVLELKKYFDIEVFEVSVEVARPQLAVYEYCYAEYGDLHDWIAFIDGDEFLYSPGGINVLNKLAIFDNKNLSAIGVYWLCFGSSGHKYEPTGLITDNFRYRANDDFKANKHFKSIVRGRLGKNFAVLQNSHFFSTPHGTYDTSMRALDYGCVEFDPIYTHLGINHYVTQSREFFDTFKQRSGAADAGSLMVRPEEWWVEHDRNEVWDNSLLHLRSELLNTMHAVSILSGD